MRYRGFGLQHGLQHCLRRSRTDSAHGFFLCLALWLATLQLGWINPAHAAETVALNAQQESYVLGQHVSYLEDQDGILTLRDVMDAHTGQRFRRVHNAAPNFSFTNSVYWFRLDLRNQDSAVPVWLLESQYPLLDHIDAHLVYAGNKVVDYRGGDTLPFSERAIKHRNVMFRVPLAPGESVTVYIRVKTESSLQLPLTLWSPQALLVKDHEEQYALGIYYGILIAMLCYNLMIFLAIRDVNYLYYLLYIGGWILFQMSLNGLAFEYLWPNYPRWGNIATPFFLAVSLVSVMLFTRAFLQIKLYLPKFDVICRIYLWLSTLLMVGTFFLHYALVIKIGAIGASTAALLVLVISILSLRRRVRQAKYFIIAWSLLLLGIIIYALKTFGVLPSIFITEYGLQIGSAIEVVLLSFALAHRMRILKEENERIQREATEMLEQRVQQRTQELDQALWNLSDANEKLKDISHIDGLTGVKNRAYFNEQFDLEWRRALRSHNPIGLLMVDIDHFKHVNDTYGHLGGDACLRQVAQCVAGAVRRPGDECFRYGGEEFVVLLANTDLAGTAHIGEIICRQIEALDILYDGKKIAITISVGASSVIPKSDVDRDSLIGNADSALYQAKHNGRNQVRVFSPVIHSVGNP
jgi:diguanylate cyclase (GGDEF)-like protein